MKSILCLFLMVILSTPLFADQPVPHDFALGMELSVSGPGTIYKISLPVEVYQNMDRTDFGDIRVFNQNNEMVPHALKRPENIKDSVLPPVSLPFFPIFRSYIKNGSMLSLNINTDSAGAIINVQTDENSKPDKFISYYLIDLTHLDRIPNELEFKWSKDRENFSIKTSLESSDNLTDWKPIITDTTLASLDFSGHSLIKNKIKLPSLKIKYLRMSWPIQAENQEITEVKVLFPGQEKTLPHQWQSLPPQSIDKKLNIYEYKISGIFPVSLVNIELPGKNQILKALLKSRPDVDSPWRTRYKGLFYSIDINGISFSNDTISLNLTTDPQWQLTVESENLTAQGKAPELKFGWIPHDLYFMNQGEGPFKIAFGNFEIKPLENLMDPLFQNLGEQQRQEMIKSALPLKPFKLGERKIKTTPIQWQKWVLWAVLVSGVLLLGIMAIRLSKQMNTSDG